MTVAIDIIIEAVGKTPPLIIQMPPSPAPGALLSHQTHAPRH